MAPNCQMFCLIIKSLYFFNIFFGSENLMCSPYIYIFFNVTSVTSTLVELKWKKLGQWNEKNKFRESRTYKRCMKDLQAFQVSFASIFPESLYETQMYKCCKGFCRFYEFDSFLDKICSTWNENIFKYWKQFMDGYNSLPMIYKWFWLSLSMSSSFKAFFETLKILWYFTKISISRT